MFNLINSSLGVEVLLEIVGLPIGLAFMIDVNLVFVENFHN